MTPGPRQSTSCWRGAGHERRPGRRHARRAGLGVAGRLDRLGPPVIYLYQRIDPELEELTIYNGNGPLRGYRGFHSPVGTPDVVIMPASEARELLNEKEERP